MKKSALNALSKAINAYLKLDPESGNRLKHLNGKVVTIQLKPFDLTFQCIFNDTSIKLEADALRAADTHISGTPIQLAAVSLLKTNRHRFFADDISMTGSAEIGHEVIALFDHMQIDWEEYLAQLIGDETAHHAGKLAKRARSWLKHIDQSFTDNVDEYIHEEAQWLPTHEALNDFFQEIDDYRMDVDRISAKINALKQKLQKDPQ